MGSLKKLEDGTLAQGVVILDDEGNLANIGPIFQQDLIGNAHNYYPDKTRGFVFGKKTGVNNALIDLWEGPTGNHFCQTTLRATCHDGILWPGVFLIQDEQGTQNNCQVIGMPIPIPIPPRADVKISAISDASNANVTALGAIMGWFEKIT